MKPIRLFSCLFAGLIAAAALPSTEPDETPSISGTLQSSDGPIAGAELTLTYYQDEACYQLANKKKEALTEDEKVRLASCRKDLPKTTADKDGRYAFKKLAPGWYALKINWDLSYKPQQIIATFQSGFFIATWERNDPAKPFHILAIGKASELKPNEARVLDFTFR